LENEFQNFFFNNPSAINIAPFSCVMIIGISKLFFAVKPVLTNPGLRIFTLIVSSNSPRRLSAGLIISAFVEL